MFVPLEKQKQQQYLLPLLKEKCTGGAGCFVLANLIEVPNGFLNVSENSEVLNSVLCYCNICKGLLLLHFT